MDICVASTDIFDKSIGEGNRLTIGANNNKHRTLGVSTHNKKAKVKTGNGINSSEGMKS
jgi:hypothetical protein